MFSHVQNRPLSLSYLFTPDVIKYWKMFSWTEKKWHYKILAFDVLSLKISFKIHVCMPKIRKILEQTLCFIQRFEVKYKNKTKMNDQYDQRLFHIIA